MTTTDTLGRFLRWHGATVLFIGHVFDRTAAAYGVDRVADEFLGVW